MILLCHWMVVSLCQKIIVFTVPSLHKHEQKIELFQNFLSVLDDYTHSMYCDGKYEMRKCSFQLINLILVAIIYIYMPIPILGFCLPR